MIFDPLLPGSLTWNTNNEGVWRFFFPFQMGDFQCSSNDFGHGFFLGLCLCQWGGLDWKSTNNHFFNDLDAEFNRQRQRGGDYLYPPWNWQFAPENRGPLEFRRFLLETTIFRGELLVLGGVTAILNFLLLGEKSREKISPEIDVQPQNGALKMFRQISWPEIFLDILLRVQKSQTTTWDVWNRS